MKKILFIGDSSLLPRKETQYDNIYTSLLKNKTQYNIEISAKTKNTSKEICTDLEAFMLYGYAPDIVVLHYGVVDLFPRPYPARLSKLLSGIGLLNRIDIFFKKIKMYYTLGNIFNFKEIKINQFSQYSREIVHKLLEKKVEKIIFVGVVKPSKVLLKSRNIHREILLYNDVYQKLADAYPEVEYIDVYNDFMEEYTIWDGYHYSERGSLYLAEQIERILGD